MTFVHLSALHSVFGCTQGQNGSRVLLVGEAGLAVQALKDQKVLYSCWSLDAKFMWQRTVAALLTFWWNILHIKVIMVNVSVPLYMLHLDPMAQLENRVMLVWLENLGSGVMSETQVLKEKSDFQ